MAQRIAQIVSTFMHAEALKYAKAGSVAEEVGNLTQRETWVTVMDIPGNLVDSYGSRLQWTGKGM